MEKGFFAWLREQFAEPEPKKQQEAHELTEVEQDPPEVISRRDLAAALGRDCYPEWFHEYGEHVWQDEIEGKKALRLLEHQKAIDIRPSSKNESVPESPEHAQRYKTWTAEERAAVVGGAISRIIDAQRIEVDPEHPEHARYVLARHQSELERVIFSIATDWVDDFRESVRLELMREIEAELGSLTDEDRELLGELWGVQTHLLLKDEHGEPEEWNEWEREQWERNEAFAAQLTEADRRFLFEGPPDRPGVRDAIQADEFGYRLSFGSADHDGSTALEGPNRGVFYSGKDCAGLLPDRTSADPDEWIVWFYGEERPPAEVTVRKASQGGVSTVVAAGIRYEAAPGDPGTVTATRVESGEDLWCSELIRVKTQPSLIVKADTIEVELADTHWLTLDSNTGQKLSSAPIDTWIEERAVRDLVDLGAYRTSDSNDVRAAARAYLRDMHIRRLGAVARFKDLEQRRRIERKRALFSGSPEAEEEGATVRGERFEHYVAKVLSAEWPGFECQHLGKFKRTERGIDLLYLGPNGERRGVQCKQHAEAREPSYQEWQSFLGGCTFHQIPEGSRLFVTTGTLSIQQQQEARRLGVVVFYGDELAQIAAENGIEPWS